MISKLLKIAFLFGAGISFPARMPSIRDITERVLSGQGIFRHTNGNYYFDEPPICGFPEEYVPKIVAFLRQLKSEIDLYYESEKEKYTNYEDLYYVASQIRDSELKEYDNPVLQAFIDKILPFLNKFKVIAERNDISNIADETIHYISDIVWHMLSKIPDRHDHICCIKDACLDTQFSKVDLYTLNHDTILEDYLHKNDIQIIDGFGEPINDVRYWNSNLFEREPYKIRLFKLHGSVNWFRFRPDGGDWSQESIGIPLNRDIWHTKGKQGERQMPVDGRPMFIAGTFNKMLQYTSGIYADLYYQFYHSLPLIERLVVCGYSFGDKGINNRIIEWIYSSGKNKLIIIHPNPNSLRHRARGAIRNKWDEIINKKLIIIPNKIEETNWYELKSILNL